ncbi:hypothetical protein EJ06DRAFT_534926 [Trichodelitschia bisporula]|uniref:Uncharacterized protein n=1 Tax=Trichodelitschia bisporula TaxID=703511 RepID=A0A6G1HHH3_9PEZI|nr:hypothetical protein EJ06DRAFT_534926 [Trichodelitschia bisporula]
MVFRGPCCFRQGMMACSCMQASAPVGAGGDPACTVCDHAFSIHDTPSLPTTAAAPPSSGIDVVPQDESFATIARGASERNTIPPDISSNEVAKYLHLEPRTTLLETVVALLERTGVVQLRGTPASGKTSVMDLLYHYLRLQGNQVHLLSRYPKGATKPWFDQLKELMPDAHTDVLCTPAYILFDEGQTSYADAAFWNEAIKGVLENFKKRPQSIKFVFACCYGSSADLGNDECALTPFTLPENCIVGLRPSAFVSVGMFFSQEEFMSWGMKKTTAIPASISNEALDMLFKFSEGHIGLATALIENFLESHHCKTIVRNGKEIQSASLEHFLFNRDGLVNVIKSCAAYRGFPHSTFRDPDVRNVLIKVAIEGFAQLEDTNPEALRKCYVKGYLHAVVKDGDSIVYTYPTEVHRWFAAITVVPHLTGPFPFKSVRECVLTGLKSFCGNALRRESKTPEAAYGAELHRTIYKVTRARIIPTPEFSSKELGGQRIDFVIPGVHWGIELLRDGTQLQEHYDRFVGEGRYTSFNFREWVVVDFRTSRPAKSLPTCPNVLFVIFDPGFFTCVVLDNMLKDVVSEFALLS